jgi:hypothetical protein
LNKTVRISFGIIQIVFSIYWIYHTVELYFLYQNPELLFAFRLPVWVLIIEIILSLLNVIFGINLIRNKINIIKSIGFFISSIAIGYLLENLYYLI